MRFLSMLCLLLFSQLLISQDMQDPVIWSYQLNDLGNREYMLQFKADIETGWTVYSQIIDGDGPVPTSINFESQGVSKVGDSEEIGHLKEGFDKIFEIDVRKYLADEPFIINQKLALEEGHELITGYLTFMTCNDEMCLPPTDIEFSFNVNDLADSKQEDGESDSKEQGGMFEPVTWKFDIEDLGNGEYLLKYTAEIDDTWNVYSQYTDDGGPIPTTITYDTPDVLELIGEAEEQGHRKEGPDPLFDNINVIKFLGDEDMVISQKIKSLDGSEIRGYLSYMTCDDEKCLMPPAVEFIFNPEKLIAGVAGEIESAAPAVEIAEEDKIDQRIQSIIDTYLKPIGNCIGGESTEDRGLLMSFLFGFLGGLLALLTPCVFPMIPLTVSFFTKDTKRKGWVNGLIYAASIVVIYVVLGLLLTAVFGPEALNRLSTNWIANSLFFIIFVAFAFSFFGYYEITLPSSWSTKSDSMADKGGFLGIFFMAFTLALVSFSCTGPIIGSAIVTAASNAVGPAIVMLGFAIALALPFGLFAAFPAWLNTLPQSGGWMNSVKVVLGFLELALAFKFLSVADMTNHWNFLRYELFMGIWVVIFFLMSLYLFGIIKFPHDSPVKKLGFPRMSIALASAAFTIYLVTGFMSNEKTGNYNSLGALSGLAPPAHYNFFKPVKAVDKDIKSKYPSYTMCANNIPCFKDYYEGLAYAREQEKLMFLDFTGFGCVNCRKVEEHIWVDDQIREKLTDAFVLVSLYVDDDKELPRKKYSVVRDNKPIRNVGNKWADFQIVNFQQNSQPLYVMVTPEEEVVAKPRGYRQNEGIDEYNAYMECGLSTYEDQKY
jgi:thiol:disulfide interchange protein